MVFFEPTISEDRFLSRMGKKITTSAGIRHLGTLSKTTPSTGRGGQFFQLIDFSPSNTYQLKELATTSC